MADQRQTPSATAGSEYRSAVLAATDVVDLIGRTVAIKKRGKNYLGLCPFHSEKSPSFNVDPVKQYFHCFGCKASGNAIDFVIKRDRVEFIDALRLLGDAAGIERPHQSAQARQQAGQRQQLLDACSAAATVFEKALADPERGAAGRAYLAERGFTPETAGRFRLGLAVDAWDALLRSPLMKAFPPPVLALAGLVKSRENGNGYYDAFRNRLMFPIRDENGRVIAFGGRVMPGSADKAKYLNSPETPLFSKSRTVFGLDFGRQRIVESRTVAVVEGYADVVMAHQYGASNVVSVLGTAMTEPHVTILRRFADKIVLLFDADAAGDTAVDRAVELFLKQPVEIAIAQMPDGLDPDEFLLSRGAEAFDALLKGAADALTFKWKQLDRQFRASGGDLTGQQKAVKHYLDLLASARGTGPVDPMRWGGALTRVSRLTGIPVEDLNRQFAARPAAKPTAPPIAKSPGEGRLDGGAPPPSQGSPRPPYDPNRPGGFRRRDGGPIEESNFTEWVKTSGRRFVPRRGGPVDDPYAPHRQYLAGRRGVPAPAAVSDAVTKAERGLLGVLLAEPHRWHDVQTTVSPATFTDDLRRRLAVEYWNHQRDEGEPVFAEFLGSLTDPAVADLAVSLVEEFEVLGDPEAQVRNAVALLAEMRERDEGRKLLAELNRIGSNGPPAAPPAAGTSGSGEDPLRLLQEKARRPDMRRIGS